MHARQFALIVAVAGVMLGSVSPAPAAAKLTKTGTARTTFMVAGPTGLAIKGTTADMTVTDDGTIVTITVPLKHLSTGMALRDENIKTALAVATYPTATLAVARASLTFLNQKSPTGFANGSFTLHGRTKMVRFHYQARKTGTTYAVTGALSFNMNDYGVTSPTYLGVTVKPTVQIQTVFDAIDE
jgi:polyisoprenoid-binding protein YceI